MANSKENRFFNENTNQPDNQPYPRIVYPNDILPDVNGLSQMRREDQLDEVKCLSSNPR